MEKILARLLLLLLCSVPFASIAKESLVLLPIQGPALSSIDIDNYRIALQQGLSSRYKVFSGSEVEKKLQKFQTKTCDATECLQNVAIEFQGELIGRVVVSQVGDGYQIAYEVKNVFADEIVESRVEACANCNSVNVIGLLKQIGSGAAMAGSVSFATSTLGAALIGGIERITPKTTNTRSTQSTAILFVDSKPAGAEIWLGETRAGIAPQQLVGLKPNQMITVTLKKQDYRDRAFQVELNGGFNELEPLELQPAFGALEITSEPSGATVTIAGKEVGITPYRTKKISSGNYLVNLSYPLYSTLSNQSITIKDGQPTEKHYTLNSNYGELIVETEPVNSQLSITESNGKIVEQQTTPAHFKLIPGNYSVRAVAEGYEPLEWNATIANGKTLRLEDDNATLRQLLGELMISSQPYRKGALVYIDGEERGEVPLTITLPKGSYNLRIDTPLLAGEQQVTVQDRESETIMVSIEEKRPKAAWLIAGSLMIQQRSDETLIANPHAAYLDANSINHNLDSTIGIGKAGIDTAAQSGFGVIGHYFLENSSMMVELGLTSSATADGRVSFTHTTLGVGYGWRGDWRKWLVAGVSNDTANSKMDVTDTAGTVSVSGSQANNGAYVGFGLSPRNGGLYLNIRYHMETASPELLLGWCLGGELN